MDNTNLLSHWQLLTSSEMEQVRQGALRILTVYGFRIHSHEVLHRLEKAGMKIDPASFSVWPTMTQIERIEEAARHNTRPTKPEPLLRRALLGGEKVGHNMTVYYDWTEGAKRAARLEDIRNVVKAWTMIPEIEETGPCMTAQDVPPVIEPIVSAAEVIKLTPKARGCPEMILAEQLPYLQELETIVHNRTVLYHDNGCSMTNFRIDDRAARCLLAVARNRLDYWWVNSTPIMGANAPLTLAGALVYGVAETLGGWLAGWAMNEGVQLSAIPLAGIMDMRTGRILFSTPETVLVDCALYQYFFAMYGIRIGLCNGYTDAKIPGLQAINDKLLKSLAYGWFIDSVGGQVGTLEAGNIYSPTQQIIDLELNRQTAQLERGIEINTDMLAVEQILEVLGDSGKSFLTHDHTLRHLRSTLWSPRLMDRTNYENDPAERAKANQVVEKAEARWRTALASYNPEGLDPDKVKAAEEVVERAKKHLLATDLA